MKIVILGAGQVGSTVAYSLSNEENDITVVDTDGAVDIYDINAFVTVITTGYER